MGVIQDMRLNDTYKAAVLRVKGLEHGWTSKESDLAS
jgi:hypothetical protein